MKECDAFIVDDDRVTREILPEMLINAGFGQVTCCRSYCEALRQLQSLECNYIFLDIELGDGNGLYLVKEIREKIPKAKIIIISSQCSMENVQRSISSGVDGILAKPFSLEKLRTTLEKQS